MHYVTTFDSSVPVDQIQCQLYELPKGPFPFKLQKIPFAVICLTGLYQIVKRAVVAILSDDVVMSLGLYTFWEDDSDDVACVYRWISGNVHQIMKVPADPNFKFKLKHGKQWVMMYSTSRSQ